MESMRYGAVPLVRRTGGLNDVIADFDPDTDAGNGFLLLHLIPGRFTEHGWKRQSIAAAIYGKDWWLTV